MMRDIITFFLTFSFSLRVDARILLIFDNFLSFLGNFRQTPIPDSVPPGLGIAQSEGKNPEEQNQCWQPPHFQTEIEKTFRTKNSNGVWASQTPGEAFARANVRGSEFNGISASQRPLGQKSGEMGNGAKRSESPLGKDTKGNLRANCGR